MKDEKLEIKKKPQEVKKEDLDKVAGGGDHRCLNASASVSNIGEKIRSEFCK